LTPRGQGGIKNIRFFGRPASSQGIQIVVNFSRGGMLTAQDALCQQIDDGAVEAACGAPSTVAGSRGPPPAADCEL
jgi:hypothetical protein